MVVPSCGQPLDQRVDLARLGGVQAGGGLVQQQQPRLCRQRAGDLQPLERAVGHRVRRGVFVAGQADQPQQLARDLPALGLGAHQRAGAQQRGGQRAALAQVPAGHHVLQRGHVEEHLQVLEGAADAGGGEAVHRLAGQVHAVEADRTGARAVHPAEHVDQAGLAGAVGADHRVHRTRLDAHFHVGDRMDAAEGLGQPADVQQRHGFLPAQRRAMLGTSPSGNSTMVATSTAPKTIIS